MGNLGSRTFLTLPAQQALLHEDQVCLCPADLATTWPSAGISLIHGQQLAFIASWLPMPTGKPPNFCPGLKEVLKSLPDETAVLVWICGLSPRGTM